MNLDSAIEDLKNWNAEAREYYNEARELNDEELMKEYRRAMRMSEIAKATGYGKAAKERGLR